MEDYLFELQLEELERLQEIEEREYLEYLLLKFDNQADSKSNKKINKIKPNQNHGKN